MRRGALLLVPVMAALMVLAAALGALRAEPLDAVLAEVDGQIVTRSDVALAHALGVLGLSRTPAPITRDDVERLVDAHLLVEEARRLDLEPDAAASAHAWEAVARAAGGEPALLGWLAGQGIPVDWARALVERDLMRQRFIALRFRAFAFVSEAEIDAALAGQAPDPAAREDARRLLTEAAVERGVAEWIAAARARARVRFLPVAPTGARPYGVGEPSTPTR